jgi:hypothetical protein
MNEFENKTKDQLERALVGLISYKQGIHDAFKIIEDNYENTMDFYEEKIRICKEEIKKKDLIK